MHAQLMDNLKDRLLALLADIPRESRIAFVDYPVHFNVGDLLIDRGTQEFFRQSHHDVVGRFSIGDLGRANRSGFEAGRSISLLDRAVRSGATIVCHGGGNLGDIWPEHQLCREMLLRRYGNAKFVFLPQSIHFTSDVDARRALGAIRSHGGVSLYVRDRESIEFAESCAAKVAVLPDMAHQLWGELDVSPPSSLKSGTLIVSRRDSEKSGSLNVQDRSFDWDDVVGLTERGLLKVFQAAELAGPTLRRHWETYPLWAFTETRLIAKAVRIFSEHETIVTDRLHAMILGALLSRRVKFSDNSYGKLGRYFEMFFADSPKLSQAD
ncbi:polysaccharide pyruvyl transferase family protein [Bradyrhizobium sp. 25ACV]